MCNNAWTIKVDLRKSARMNWSVVGAPMKVAQYEEEEIKQVFLYAIKRSEDVANLF